MELSQLKTEQLDDILSKLTLSAVRDLLAALERDQAPGKAGDASGVIIQRLQKHLNSVNDGSACDIMAREAFENPFADLISQEVSSIKQTGRIAESSVDAIWTWLKRDLLPNALPTLFGQINAAASAQDQVKLAASIGAMRKEITKALDGQLNDLDPQSMSYMRLSGHVGGTMSLEDAREMGQMIKLDKEIDGLRSELGHEITDFDEPNYDRYIKLYQAFDEQTDGLGWFVLLTMMRRLNVPALIVRLVTRIMGSKREIDIRGDKIAVVCECALHDMEIAARRAAKLIRDQRNIGDVIAEVKTFYVIAEEFSDELDIDLKGPWANNLVRVRGILADAVREQISDAPRRVKAALFCGIGRRTADEPMSLLTKGPDEIDLQGAEFAVKLLLDIRPCLDQLPINAEYPALRDQVLQFVERIGDATVDRMRQCEVAERDAMAAYLDANVHFTMIVFGDEAGELLRRQGKVGSWLDDTKKTA